MSRIVIPGIARENFATVRELAELVASGPPEPSQIGEIAGRYGLEFGQPDWLPGIVTRFNLTPMS